MKGSLSAAEVHKQYSEGVTAFRRQIADATRLSMPTIILIVVVLPAPLGPKKP